MKKMFFVDIRNLLLKYMCKSKTQPVYFISEKHICVTVLYATKKTLDSGGLLSRGIDRKTTLIVKWNTIYIRNWYRVSHTLKKQFRARFLVSQKPGSRLPRRYMCRFRRRCTVLVCLYRGFTGNEWDPDSFMVIGYRVDRYGRKTGGF